MKSNTQLLELLNNYKMEELKIALLENIREEIENGKGTKASDKAIVNRLYKTAQKLYNNGFKKINVFGYNGIIYNGLTEGHYVLCDSTNDYSIEHAEEHEKIDFSKFFASICDYDIEHKIDINSLNYFKKTHKKTEKIPYIELDESEKILAFDPYFLLDCLNFCETDTIYYSNPINKQIINPVFIHNSDYTKIALCLPIYVKDADNVINNIKYNKAV